MRAFEIHLYQNGKWKIDSSFDDRDLAMYEARRIDASGRYIGVRVVEETFDEGTQEVSSRTIFRGSRIDQLNNDHMERSKTVREEAMAGRRERREAREAMYRKRAESARNKKSNPMRLVMLLTLLTALGFSALIGLRYLRSML